MLYRSSPPVVIHFHRCLGSLFVHHTLADMIALAPRHHCSSSSSPPVVFHRLRPRHPTLCRSTPPVLVHRHRYPFSSPPVIIVRQPHFNRHDCPWVWACLSFMITQVHCGPGTTANIEEIFFGRCYQYQEITTNKLLKPPPSSIDCPLLWDTFKSAFVYKDPTAITRADYQPFFDLAKQTNIPANKSVLWSGTYDITHRYAADGTRYVTMEDSLIGYLSNGLHWCGSQSSGGGGINYTQCPDWTDLPTQASQAFWGGASSTFAGNSKGEIKLILSGSNPTRKAYERSSFFANFELPSINVHDATVSVVLANDVGKPALEQCDTGSLILLREDMTDRGLEFNCQENPRDILYLMCVDNPTAKKCQFSSPTQSKSIVDLVNPKSKNLVG